jgi:hypothetical protein
MQTLNDLSRSLIALEPASTRGPIVVVSLFSGAWSRPLTQRTSSTRSGANTLSWSQLFDVTRILRSGNVLRDAAP